MPQPPRVAWDAFHERAASESSRPVRSWWPTMPAVSAAALVQSSQVSGAAVPSGSEPVRMSWRFGWSPRPLTVAPVSSSAVALAMALPSPWRASTLSAISSPLALCHGPSPMRSRASTSLVER